MHRDLTPFNVFVCAGNELKLGDFGIATHQLNPRGVTADAFNLFHVPNEIAWGRVRRWQKRDDVYQIGLLAAMLLRGDITSPMRSKDVRTLPCSDHLKEVVHRCLGARAKRYQAANAKPFGMYGARFLVRGGRQEVLEGKARSRTVVLEFPSYEAALGCYRSPEYQAAKALRQGKADADLVVIEGYDGK